MHMIVFRFWAIVVATAGAMHAFGFFHGVAVGAAIFAISPDTKE